MLAEVWFLRIGGRVRCWMAGSLVKILDVGVTGATCADGAGGVGCVLGRPVLI